MFRHCLALLVLLSSQAWAKESEKSPVALSNVSSLGATWRSAVVPGWGQWYRGDRWWGISYLGATALAGGLSFMYNNSGNNAYNRYLGARTATDAVRLYDEAKQQDQMWAIMSYTAVGIYALNLADAWFFTKRSGPRAMIMPPMSGESPMLALQWRI